MRRKGLDLRPSILAQLCEDLTGALVVPVLDFDGQLSSGQCIHSDGFKDYAPGVRIAGGMIDPGQPDSVSAETRPLRIVEGFSRCCKPGRIVAAFHANNLAAVANIWRQCFLHCQVAIAGDNDHFIFVHHSQIVSTPCMHDRRRCGRRQLVPSFSSPASDGADGYNPQREKGSASIVRRWSIAA